MNGTTKPLLILAILALVATPPFEAGAASDQRAKGAEPGKRTIVTSASKRKTTISAPAKPSRQGSKPAPQKKPNKPTATKTPAASLAAKKNVPVPRARPQAAPRLGSSIAAAVAQGTAGRATPTYATASILPTAPAPMSVPTSPGAAAGAPAAQLPEADLAAVKKAVELARKGKASEAESLQKTIRDPAARKLVEWTILYSDNNNADSTRYLNFIQTNPGWPSIRMFRRRAENQLWSERPDPMIVRALFSQTKPTTARGKLALARALLAQGDRTAASYYLRSAWREEPFSADLEKQAIDTFGDLLNRADHKARMDRMLYSEEADVALRAAKRLGANEVALHKARHAVSERAGNAAALLDAVPKELRADAGYIFSRIQHLRRNDRIAEATQLMLAAPRDPNVIRDTNEWWIERRLIARKHLDLGDPKTAYAIARQAAEPTKESYRAEHEFTAGWIALRFLNDPAPALAHFARVGRDTTNPITLARASYWQGRAAEALGRQTEARAHYDAAARFPTAYYGQLARVKLNVSEVGLRRPANFDGAQLAALRNLDIVRAVEIMYAVGQRDLVPAMVADMADRMTDPGHLTAIARISERNQDARSVLLIGKLALARGAAFDHFAFPTIGVPAYSAVGPEVDRSVVFAIARQESHFNQRTVSTANALGLMQVTPPAGRYIAKKFGVPFDQKRLLADPVYNTQMGAAELGDLLRDYRGSYVLSFAAYNAGRGRVREWIERFGDPRDPRVDPVDWVERIPFSETRNYVQRVMENMQVYRARFGSTSRLLIEADMRRGGSDPQ